MKALLIISILIFSLPSYSFDFKNFNTILQSNVKTDRVDEAGLQTSFDYQKAYDNPETRTLIDLQKKKLAEFKISSLSAKNEAIAFWINSYNFFMLTVILDMGFKKAKLSINSVKDLGTFFSPYAIFKKEMHNVGGKKISLDHMEKTILLGEEYKQKGWKDARIHFAVNCASVGCPPLLDAVYNPKTLDLVLDSNLKQAFKTKRHLKVEGKTLHLTSLFKWYKKDFEEDSGSIKAFIKKYVDEATYKKIKSTSKTRHIKYDWNLNTPSNFK